MLYLAFEPTVFPDPNQISFVRGAKLALLGHFRHCELVFRQGVQLFGFSVRAIGRYDTTAYCVQRPFEEKWVFLAVPCSEENEYKARVRAREIVDRGDFFDPYLMAASGCPFRPDVLVPMIMGETPLQKKGNACPTFCAMACVQAMQAAGLLTHVPASMVTASDLFAYATRLLGARRVPRPVDFPASEDSAGIPMSLTRQRDMVFTRT